MITMAMVTTAMSTMATKTLRHLRITSSLNTTIGEQGEVLG